MASYFAVYKGMEEGLAKLALASNPAHDTPVVQRAYQMLEAPWIDVRADSTPPQRAAASTRTGYLMLYAYDGGMQILRASLSARVTGCAWLAALRSH